jgi:hypothetical protein
VLRSVFAVVTGYLVMMVTVGLATFVLQAIEPAWFRLGTPPPPQYLALSAAYSAIAAFCAGWLTGRFGQVKPLQHAIAMALLAFLLSIVPALMFGVRTEPRWFQVVPSVLMPATVIAGGWLRARALEASAP